MSEPTTPINQPVRSSTTTPPPIHRKSFMEDTTYEEGDFIKPDPAFTRLETRKYILKELRQCLTERILLPTESECSNAQELESVSNPRERLYQVKKLLEEKEMDKNPGEVSYEVIEAYLMEKEDTFPDDIKVMALGFIQTDCLPNGNTIESYWNYSPFDNLRNAPMLSDETGTSLSLNGNMISLSISIPHMLIILIAITIWIAMTVSQMKPVHPLYR